MQNEQKDPSETKKCPGCLQPFPLAIFNGKSRFFAKQYRERQKLIPVPDDQQRCVSCRKDFPIEVFAGVKSCPKCRERANAKSRARVVKLRHAVATAGNRICKACGGEFPDAGKKMCPSCTVKQRKRCKEYRANLNTNDTNSERRCRRCIQILSVDLFGGKFLTCSKCRDEESVYRQTPKIFNRRKITARNYRKNNSARVRAKQHKYYLEHKNEFRAYRREYVLNKLRTDPIFKLQHRARSRIVHVLKNLQLGKACKSTELIGCDWKTFKQHIENQFKPGMTWENYGFYGWHADHKRPISSFDMSEADQQKAAFHYTNTQPLWWWENFSKGDKMPEEITA